MYTFQQEKIQLPTLSPMKLNYELTITPSNECLIQSDVQINPSMIVERIDLFRRSLFQIVKSHHRVRFHDERTNLIRRNEFFRIFFLKNFSYPSINYLRMKLWYGGMLILI